MWNISLHRAIPQLKLLPSEFHPPTPVSSNTCGTNSPIPDETDNESSNELIGESIHEVTVASSAGDRNTESPSNDIQDQSMSSTSPSTSKLSILLKLLVQKLLVQKLLVQKLLVLLTLVSLTLVW